MQVIFWVMTFMALPFVLTPLLRANRQGTPAFLIIALPALATLGYLAIGSPDVESATSHASVTQTGNRDAASQPGSVASLTAGLEARLARQADDGEGWLLLAKSYFYLDRLDDARQAYARAAALGNVDETVARQIGADSAMTSGLAGSVSLSAEAAGLVEPGDTIFIFARPPGQGGAPVAVVRKTAETWPLEFRLTDTQSMTTGTRLSDHEQVVVTARVSRRGDANPALRALEAKSPPIDVAGDAPLHLTIE
jgi:hypothetical protein